MNERYLCLLSGCADQEIGRRNATVISTDCEQVLQLTRSPPQLCGHCYGLECIQALGDFSRARLVRRQADKLHDDEIAHEDQTVGYPRVEP
jgi:hypothetical protein